MKNTLLTGIALLAANTALANVHDILTWGEGNVDGGQKLELTGELTSDQSWKADNTGLTLYLSNGIGISTGPLPINNFSSSTWSNSEALDALYAASGKSSIDDFSGLTKGLFVGAKNSSSTDGIKIEFRGFELGKSYKIALLVKPQDNRLTIRTGGSAGGGYGLNIVCQYGDMGTQGWTTSSERWNQAPITAGSQTLVTLDVTPTHADSALVLFFDNENNSQTTGVSAFAIGTISISAIPEPSAFSMLAGLGVLALAGTRRRKRA